MRHQGKKKEDIYYAQSCLLNRPGFHSVSAAAYDLHVDDLEFRKDNGDWIESNGQFFISDCSRVISLDLEVGSEAHYENTIFKLQTLKKVVEEAIADTAAARMIYLKSENIVEQRKKAKDAEKKD